MHASDAVLALVAVSHPRIGVPGDQSRGNGKRPSRLSGNYRRVGRLAFNLVVTALRAEQAPGLLETDRLRANMESSQILATCPANYIIFQQHRPTRHASTPTCGRQHPAHNSAAALKIDRSRTSRSIANPHPVCD